MQKLILSIITLALFLPNLFDTDINTSPHYNGKEKFDPKLSFINSIGQLEKHIDSLAKQRKVSLTGYEYVELLDSVVEQRFYHGFSHFTLKENWVTALAGRYIKEDYACKVQPEKIIQHPNAACSQQALVMMAVLRDKKITYRSLGFPHHYAIEVLINNEWYFFDTNMEPNISKEQRMLSSWKHRNDNLKQYYNKDIFTDLNYQFGKHQTAVTGTLNEIPAQKAANFHITTGILSKIAWLFPLIFILLRYNLIIEVPFVSLLIKKQKPSVSLSV